MNQATQKDGAVAQAILMADEKPPRQRPAPQTQQQVALPRPDYVAPPQPDYSRPPARVSVFDRAMSTLDSIEAGLRSADEAVVADARRRWIGTRAEVEEGLTDRRNVETFTAEGLARLRDKVETIKRVFDGNEGFLDTVQSWRPGLLGIGAIFVGGVVIGYLVNDYRMARARTKRAG